MRSTVFALFLGLVLGPLVPAAAAADSWAPPDSARLRVLFVGNSLIYENDLPGIVEAVAAAANGGPALTVGTVAFPNYSLEDHWNRGAALKAIDGGGWDVVILQQGPSTSPESRGHLIAWTGRFAERIRAAGGRPALLMVWPPRSQAGGADAVRDSYAEAARTVDGILIPAGEAWREAWAEDPDLPLYASDDFHPSLLGSVAAAYVIWHVLTGRSPIGLPPRIEGEMRRVAMTPEQAALLQAAAAAAVARTGPG